MNQVERDFDHTLLGQDSLWIKWFWPNFIRLLITALEWPMWANLMWKLAERSVEETRLFTKPSELSLDLMMEAKSSTMPVGVGADAEDARLVGWSLIDKAMAHRAWMAAICTLTKDYGGGGFQPQEEIDLLGVTAGTWKGHVGHGPGPVKSLRTMTSNSLKFII